MPPELGISVRALTWALGSAIALLLVGHVVGGMSYLGWGSWNVHPRIQRLVMFHEEANLPTWFSSSILLLAAAVSGILAAVMRGRSNRTDRYWAGLVLVFVYMSVDETAILHEQTVSMMQRLFGATGIFFYAWVIPFGILALVIGAMYVPFLFRLPKHTATLLGLSGALFLTGTIGMEMVEGIFAERPDSWNAVPVTVEETFEMSGVSLYIVAALRYLREQCGEVRIRLNA